MARDEGQIRDVAAPWPRITLLDYVVLEVIEQWDFYSRAKSVGLLEDIAARQKALIIYTAGELVLRGYPLELSLRFRDPDVATHISDMVESVAVDHSLEAMMLDEFVGKPDRAVPHYFLPAKGRHALGFYVRDAVRRFDIGFGQLSPAYFIFRDVQRSGRRYEEIPRLERYLADTVESWRCRNTVDFRLALVQLGVQLVHNNIAPRGYIFHKKYAQLSRGFARRVIEERARSR